jgi:hypothetical protein
MSFIWTVLLILVLVNMAGAIEKVGNDELICRAPSCVRLNGPPYVYPLFFSHK